MVPGADMVGEAANVIQVGMRDEDVPLENAALRTPPGVKNHVELGQYDTCFLQQQHSHWQGPLHSLGDKEVGHINILPSEEFSKIP